MIVPFGFGPGDIAAAIRLITKILQALRESGTSSVSFQEASQYLNGLLLTLQHLESLKLDHVDPALVNAVRSLTVAVEKPVIEFVNDIKKFDETLNIVSSKAGYITSKRRVEWAIRVSKKVDEVRLKTVAQLQPLHLLLESHGLQSTGQALQSMRDLQRSVDLFTSQQVDFNSTILRAIEDIKPDENRFTDRISQRSLLQDSRSSDMSTSADPVDCEHIITTPITASTHLREWKALGHELLILLQHLLVNISELLRYLLLLTPQLFMVIRKALLFLPRAPTLLLDDNIRFEDVFGRQKSLPYVWFSNWNIFEAFLKDSFKNTDGDLFVERGQYELYKQNGLVLGTRDKGTWMDFASARSRIYMAVKIKKIESTRIEKCPRCNAKLVYKSFDTEVPCLSCDWIGRFSNPYRSMQLSAAQDRQGQVLHFALRHENSLRVAVLLDASRRALREQLSPTFHYDHEVHDYAHYDLKPENVFSIMDFSSYKAPFKRVKLMDIEDPQEASRRQDHLSNVNLGEVFEDAEEFFDDDLDFIDVETTGSSDFKSPESVLLFVPVHHGENVY